MVHFVGFRDDRYWNACRVFGLPDFIHRRWDKRAAREIDQPAVLADQRHRLDLRDPAQFVLQQVMEFDAAHFLGQRRAARHPIGTNAVGDAREDEVDRLERALGLLGERQAEIRQLAFLVEQLALPQMQDDGRIGRKQQHDQQCRAGVEATQCSPR